MHAELTLPGFYIQSCPKMRYKGEYSPSYLLDPEEYSWHPLDECKPLLSKHRYACFAHPEHSIEEAFVASGDDRDVFAYLCCRFLLNLSTVPVFDTASLATVLLLTMNGGGMEARPVMVCPLCRVRMILAKSLTGYTRMAE